MTSKFKLLLLVLVCFLFQSQKQAPNGSTYTNECVSQESFDETGFAHAYFNDPDADCLSNDFIIYFTFADGSVSTYTNYDWLNNHPQFGGVYDFNDGFWGCCGIIAAGDDGCECHWSYDPQTEILSIFCPEC